MTYPIFPTLPGIEFPVQRAPKWNTLRQKAISGRETFQPLRPWPLWSYEVSFSLLRAGEAYAEWQALAGFFNSVMATPGGVFQFDDPNDNSIAGQPVASGDGATTSFQLVRSLGGFAEPVLNPLTGAARSDATEDDGNFGSGASLAEDDGSFAGAATVFADDGYFSLLQVWVAGRLADPALGAGGTIAFATAPAAGAAIVWSGRWTWLCRFDEDSLAFGNFMYLFWELKKCAFTTILA